MKFGAVIRAVGLAVVTAGAPPLARAADAESMFDATSYRSLVAQEKASRVGDILTVIVQESASATSTTDLRAQRNASATALFGTSATSPHSAQLRTGSDNDGGGRTERTGRLLATLSARVTDVTPGGDLLINGQQTLRINGEEQTITLSGLVRVRDIGENNTVASSRIADARVQFSGEGFVSQKSQPSWWARLLTTLGF